MNKLFTWILLTATVCTSCDRRSNSISPLNDAITPANAVNFTANMGGSRNWIGTRYVWCQNGPDSDSNIYEAFALGIYGDSAITVKDDTLRMISADSTNGMIIFSVNINTGGQYGDVAIYHFYGSDSMAYSKTTTIGHGYQEVISLHTQ